MEAYDELVLKFFKVFSKSEYALKKSGYNNFDGEKIKAKAWWMTFADKIESDFYTEIDKNENLKVAFDYIWGKQPKEQMLTNKKVLIFENNINENSKSLRCLFDLVMRVRNNLFHGGKHLDIERNKKLLENSIIIIENCMKLNDTVRCNYEE